MTRTNQKYHENAVEMVLALVLRMSGNCRVEEQVRAGDGLTDIVVETKDVVYIVELKTDKKPEEALLQIETRNYVDKYLKEPRYQSYKVIGIGLSFNSANCQLTGYDSREFIR